ncbi:MAG: GAF domain-containing protein [Coleofasciculus sp. G1-WW12-02]|uniref:GAF domain-containing protein n=1 Tax=Coleofasciculus sp. G1-WW12-02 TaxID=3068483 RepID=UPI0032FDD5E6
MSNHQDLNFILTEMLVEIAQCFKKNIQVDRVHIFLLDRYDPEQCLVLSLNGSQPLELRIPNATGIGGIANLKIFLEKPFDGKFHCKDNDLDLIQSFDYIVYNLLSLPLYNKQDNIVAFVQLINKLKPEANPDHPLDKKIDNEGFDQDDEKQLNRAMSWIRSTVDRCQALYAEIKKQDIFISFIKAIHTISQGGLNFDSTLQIIIQEANELMNADRSRLWLMDRERQELWTKVETEAGNPHEERHPMGVGFVGQVAKSGKALNIPFDLYIHPGVDRIKQRDCRIGYRTCSLLCLPVVTPDNEVLGVLELINKKKRGNFPAYDPDTWPIPPDIFKASFSQADQQLMGAFALQVGIALQNSRQFASLKQQEEIQRLILKTLDNGVIYTDAKGRIITVNKKAHQLLNSSELDGVEGSWIGDFIQVKESNFAHLVQGTLTEHQDYHAPHTVIANDQEYSIDLSIRSIAENNGSNNFYGLVVVLKEINGTSSPQVPAYHQVSQELSQEFLKKHESQLLDHPNVAILCADIQGYTNLMEDMEAETVVSMLNHYCELMVQAVLKYQGTLNQYIGDALIAVFDTSLPVSDRAWYAVQAALDMRQQLTEFNRSHLTPNQPMPHLGIGIHADRVHLSQNSSQPPLSGDIVNFTSLLEQGSRDYGSDIIISETIYKHCRDRVWVRELDRLPVKSKPQSLAIYELLGLRSQSLSSQQEQIIDHYQQGRRYYLNQQFALAIGEFSQVLAIDGGDKAARLHIQRCLYWLDSPPPPDWDGVWTLSVEF